MREQRPVSTKELCRRLGISLATFYRTRGRLHVEEGLPHCLTRFRPYRWDRASIDAWFGRYHPLAPQRAPANDDTSPLVPDSDAEHQAALHRHYSAAS
jgi:predicted DNA-binding transcriptional regulator AlpA